MDPLNIPKDFKAGYVSIVGRPNVGKSTLMNALIGEKLSGVTPKPQTTRQNIKGFFNDEKRQIIFLDTPGFLKPRYTLQEKMREYIQISLSDSDVVLFVTDTKNFPTDYDQELGKTLSQIKIPRIAALNKIDSVDEETLENARKAIQSFGFDRVLEISALQKKNLDTLLDTLSEYMPFSPPLYDPEDLSDLPLRFFVQEIIRERIFMNYGEEIPYATAVVVESFQELPEMDVIHANIWIERKSQKPIIIGKKGVAIGNLRRDSEREIRKLTGRPVELNLWVKIKPNWRKKPGALKEFGYK